jgi:hypothetical protein
MTQEVQARQRLTRPAGGALLRAGALFLGILLVGGVLRGAEELGLDRSRAEIIDILGKPTREIGTGTGVLLFYGPVFLEIEDDRVVYINASSFNSLVKKRHEELRRRLEAALPETAPEVAGYRILRESERAEWLDRRRKELEQVMELRMRRFLLTETFRTLLRERPVRFDDRQVASLRQRASREAFLDLFRSPAEPASNSVSFIALRDSQGQRVPGYGEELKYRDRHVTIFESFLSSPSSLD